MRVFCYPVDRASTYVPLLFVGIENEFEPVYRQEGSLDDALAELDAGRAPIVHVHWEEFVLRACESDAQADAAAAAFVAQIATFRERGGAIVWTVHNEVPHEISYVRQFLVMRRALAHCAAAILIHNEESRRRLAAQVALDAARVRVLPHPSYLGRFEDEATLVARLDDQPRERRIQAFGWIRRQKGYEALIRMLPPDYLHSRGAFVRISGDGAEVAASIARDVQRRDIEWDVRHVPDGETPQLLRSAACVVLPYERILTSGVALLAMSVGAVMVAVDAPQMRDLLPPCNDDFLYAPGDAAALRRALDRVFALTTSERRALLEANLARARTVRPREIAQRLANVYREVIDAST